MSGWLKLHRQLKDWEWYDDINTSRLFIHCLIRANFKDTKWKGQEVLKGSFITSLDTLRQETNLTISQLRTAFSKLESTGEIEMKSQARSRTVTVVRYDLYQGDSKLDEDEINTKSQANRDEIATGIELNNLITKEVKKTTPDRFAEFWNLYGKKTDSSKCKSKFSKLSVADIDLLFDKLPAYIKSTPDKQYRKNPITWLNGKCWNDEIINNNQAKSTHTFETQNYTSGKF